MTTSRQQVTKPKRGDGGGYPACWVEKRIHTGSLYSSYSGCYARCTKNARASRLTCHWHDTHETAAQELSARLKEATFTLPN